jgi:hypothetical protein
MLTDEQKRAYITLAQQIYEGKHNPQMVFAAFQEYPDEASEIVNFWLQYNDFTQIVVHYLAIEKYRILCEKCYRKEIDKWTLTKHNLRLILNGLKQTLFGVRDSIIGAEHTQKRNGNNLHF